MRETDIEERRLRRFPSLLEEGCCFLDADLSWLRGSLGTPNNGYIQQIGEK